MDVDVLVPLPVFDAVAQTAATFLINGNDVAIVGPPGSGVTSVGAQVQQRVSAAKIPCAPFDCAADEQIDQRLKEFSGPKRNQGESGVILVDHAASLSLAQLKKIVARLDELSRQGPTAIVWLGWLDARAIKATDAIELSADTRTHLCLPELSRDDLLRLYESIATREERFWGRWGEAMLYF